MTCFELLLYSIQHGWQRTGVDSGLAGPRVHTGAPSPPRLTPLSSPGGRWALSLDVTDVHD